MNEKYELEMPFTTDDFAVQFLPCGLVLVSYTVSVNDLHGGYDDFRKIIVKDGGVWYERDCGFATMFRTHRSGDDEQEHVEAEVMLAAWESKKVPLDVQP